jgi:hypothetical protein
MHLLNDDKMKSSVGAARLVVTIFILVEVERSVMLNYFCRSRL